MYSRFQLTSRYLKYYFAAANSKGHGIHSPFVFDLITKVFNDNAAYPAYSQIESVRSSLLNDNRVIEITDLGAGTRVKKTGKRSIKEIARHDLKPKKFAALLFRLIKYFQAETILELGTSLGVTTSYLASANPNSSVYTMEGAENVAAVAAENFRKLGLSNIRIVTGNFDDRLKDTLQLSGKADFVFLDGNHRFHPTINYFEQLLDNTHNDSVIVLDDIHWSADMEKAWDHCRNHPTVTLSIDLFFIGIVFFRKEFKQKQEFTIRF
jgi:predicted O-methyltransferase YrrM